MRPSETRKPRPSGNRDAANIKHHSVTVSPIHQLLDKLDGVKQTRPNRWQARCPAHDDRSPSLAITETSEGTILVKCWAGCGAGEIVGAVGLELKDLFPPRFDGAVYQASKPPRYSAHEVVKTVITEATILELAYRTLERGDELSLPDQGRVWLAIDAIRNLREVVR